MMASSSIQRARARRRARWLRWWVGSLIQGAIIGAAMATFLELFRPLH